jgi:hypothetical protein
MHTATMLRKLRRRYAGRDGDILFFEVSPGAVEAVERSRVRAWAERGWETREKHVNKAIAISGVKVRTRGAAR